MDDLLQNINIIYERKKTIHNIISNMKNSNENNLDISGPNMIGYFTNTLNNKKIILMGDIHASKSGSCINNNETITTYIDSMRKNTKVTIDLFLETLIQEKTKLKSLKLAELSVKTTDYFRELINYSHINYKKYNNLRIHFTDIRSDLNKIYILLATEKFRTGYDLIDLLKLSTSLKDDNDLLKIYDKYSQEYDNFIFATFKLITRRTVIKGLEQYSSDLLLKEINKLYDYNKEYYNRIAKIIASIITDYLDVQFSKNRKISVDKENSKMLEEKLKLLEDLYIKGIKAGAVINDMYVLCRILKSTEFNNCIFYGGTEHYKVIKQCLLATDFVLKKEIIATEPNIRCVKNIIPFEKFFLNKLIK